MADETKRPTSPENETPEERRVRMIAEAKARVDAAKAKSAESGGDAPKPPVKKKEEGPKPVDAGNHPLVIKLKKQFAGAIIEANEFLNQLSVYIEPSRIVDVCTVLKNDSETSFDYLTDITCVHYPVRDSVPFEIVYNLYSISKTGRVRLKTKLDEGQTALSVCEVWKSANWLEREIFDLFGIRFQNHPDMRRILLPTDWQGHPLRKDYNLEFVENEWTKKHLPPMDDVEKEQIAQRRGYGLEILCVPEEKIMREIMQGGKEVMQKDK